MKNLKKIKATDSSARDFVCRTKNTVQKKNYARRKLQRKLQKEFYEGREQFDNSNTVRRQTET